MNILSLKYQKFAKSGCEDIAIENLSLWQRLNSLVKVGALMKCLKKITFNLKI